MPVASSHSLTTGQREAFLRDGYLMLPDVLTSNDLDPLIAEINDVIDRQARRLHAEGCLSDAFAEEGLTTRLTRITAETEAVYWSLAGGQHCGAAMFDLIRNEKLLDIAEALVGPEIVASSAYRIRPKVPGFGHGVVPWHQDSGYFEAACDSAMIPTVWIPLVDATAENGCLQVIPGVHHDVVLRHMRYPSGRYLVIVDEEMPPVEAVTVPVPCGGILLLSNRTPHCSTENSTDVVRWSVDIRYQGAEAPSPALPDDMKAQAEAMTVARLESLSASDIPATCYAPEADFMVRSRRHPEAVVATWEEFHRIRTTHTPGPAPRRWDLS